jgi:SAM-dependent methyltransferase
MKVKRRFEMAHEMNADRYIKKHCRYCESELPKYFLDLGLSPLANSFVPKECAGEPEFKCPLRLTRCRTCGLVQLTHVVAPDMLFAHYLYVSSTTKTFKQHFAEYAAAVRKSLYPAKGHNALAVDIGSNDGLLLSCYRKEGLFAVGVDPAKNLCEDANRRGLKTINRYFDAACVETICKEFGHADAVSANNVFAHIDDIHGVCRNVYDLLDDQGMFVIEFPYLFVMLKDLVFDMIYHEHLSYIAVHPLRFVLGKFGFEIFDIQEVASHGGSLRVFIQKKGAFRPVRPVVADYLAREEKEGYLCNEPYLEFARRVMEVKEKLNRYVARIKAEGKSISGYGAAAKATTIINFCELTPAQIDYIVDDNPLKQNHLVPGVRIPIVPNAYLQQHPTDYVIIFAWNFAREIMIKNAALAEKNVKFIVPLPSPEIAAPALNGVKS